MYMVNNFLSQEDKIEMRAKVFTTLMRKLEETEGMSM